MFADVPGPSVDDSELTPTTSPKSSSTSKASTPTGFAPSIPPTTNNKSIDRRDSNSNNIVPTQPNRHLASVAAAYKNLSACSVVLSNIDALARKSNSGLASGSTTSVKEAIVDQFEHSEDDDSDGELFEIEESEAPHVPLYHLRDEGAVKWALLTDLCLMLKVKSKDTLLKQVNKFFVII